MADREREPGAERAVTLAALYRAHADLVWRTLVRLGIPEHAAEDLVHEVFLVARRRLDSYEPARASPGSWLYGLARGVAANWRRAEDRGRRRLSAIEPPTTTTDPEHELARARATALVESFLAGLDPEQREIFVLSDVEGLRGPEVADAVGLRPNQVYSKLRLARRHFVAYLAAHGVRVDAEGP